MNSNVSSYRIAGTVVLYNPPDEVISNIKTYLPYIEKLFAVDNSETKNPAVLEFLKTDPKIVYIDNGGNKGIAFALNVAADRAAEDRFDFLLTMDQDSSFDPEHISQFTGRVLQQQDIARLGILSPYHESKADREKQKEFKEFSTTMTSGNLLSLHAYKDAGKFNEAYFIDYVDHEYCFRLRKKGYSIIQANRITINHKLGQIRQKKFLGIKLSSSNHSPLRRYYMMRNRLDFIKRYMWFDPKFCFRSIFAIAEETAKVILLEEHKGQKIKMSFAGFFDFVRGKFGKYAS
jgi:rhamnosyltransferase